MSDAARAVRIGLLGCGTVGGGVVRLLSANAASFAARVGAPLEVARVLVRSRDKERVSELDRSLLTTTADDVFGDPSIDVFVEVMGGVTPAQGYIERAIDRGASVVTANKMLLAQHGPALIERALGAGVDLAFEGSVGGGIPVVRVLRDACASDRIVGVTGIVNGTSNYILTAMAETGVAFGDALRDAQAKGYAEADPTLDIGGHDAAHKLAILAVIAFGARIPDGAIPTEGVDRVEPIDHVFAARFGFIIKHLAIARRTEAGLDLRVHPSLLERGTPLAHVDGVLNAIALEGEALGPCILSGRGAGDMPTAVSVVADILDVARARRVGAAGLLTRGLRVAPSALAPMADTRTRYYLRFPVKDRPGVLARIARALGDAGVSIEQVVQERPAASEATSGSPVQIVMLTHEAVERDVQRALASVREEDFVVGRVQLLRAEGR
jgi:homoserine dehydrogenase